MRPCIPLKLEYKTKLLKKNRAIAYNDKLNKHMHCVCLTLLFHQTRNRDVGKRFAFWFQYKPIQSCHLNNVPKYKCHLLDLQKVHKSYLPGKNVCPPLCWVGLKDDRKVFSFSKFNYQACQQELLKSKQNRPQTKVEHIKPVLSLGQIHTMGIILREGRDMV